MLFNPEIHHRTSIRLKDYDYSQAGAYFVTVCAWKKEYLFGEIKNGEMRLNECGETVAKCWDAMPDHFHHVELDEFVIMPNHIHAIIVIVGAQFIAPVRNAATENQGAINHAPTVGEILRAFKARCTHAINHIRKAPGVPVWQRNYYEHIIRNEPELHAIREYIRQNPLKWDIDEENPQCEKDRAGTAADQNQGAKDV